jgi:hypothetical protein
MGESYGTYSRVYPRHPPHPSVQLNRCTVGRSFLTCLRVTLRVQQLHQVRPACIVIGNVCFVPTADIFSRSGKPRRHSAGGSPQPNS